VVRVSTVVAHDGGVRLKCAGWVPHDDDSDVNVTAVYRRASPTISFNRIVAHRFSAGWFTHRVKLPVTGVRQVFESGGYIVASDQQQPASSRAMARLATSGFLPRSVKCRHRL